MNRWYDNNNGLTNVISLFKDMDSKKREAILSKTINLIDKKHPEIRNRFVFDLQEKGYYHNRWYDKYDKYPYIWLLFNMLPYADQALLNQINSYLEERLFSEVDSFY